jgi:3-methyladenine DNA glycosylase/8-oxoguanine DNA glycosylase
VGPWTSSRVMLVALGDADAVCTGDLHLPHLVTWALAGEPRGSDERMLELLEPFRGHRARVQRLLLIDGVSDSMLRRPVLPRSMVRVGTGGSPPL